MLNNYSKKKTRKKRSFNHYGNSFVFVFDLSTKMKGFLFGIILSMSPSINWKKESPLHTATFYHIFRYVHTSNVTHGHSTNFILILCSETDTLPLVGVGVSCGGGGGQNTSHLQGPGKIL